MKLYQYQTYIKTAPGYPWHKYGPAYTADRAERALRKCKKDQGWPPYSFAFLKTLRVGSAEEAVLLQDY